MPRTSKKAEAHQLLTSLLSGPNDIANGPATITPDTYNLWVSTWILPRLQHLIPELTRAEFRYATSQPQPVIIHGYTDNE